MIPVLVRPSKADDLPYVVESWILTIHPYCPEATVRELKYAIRTLIVESTVLVAVVPDDEDAILGFAVIHRSSGDTLFSYTRRAARGLGVQDAIFRKARSN